MFFKAVDHMYSDLSDNSDQNTQMFACFNFCAKSGENLTSSGTFDNSGVVCHNVKFVTHTKNIKKNKNNLLTFCKYVIVSRYYKNKLLSSFEYYFDIEN